MTPGCVFLVRHGRTALNAEHRLRGHLDPPLDATGRAEADAVGRLLAAEHIVAVVASPLARAIQTGEAIARATGAPLRTDPGLIDRDYGEWAGALEAEVIEGWGTPGAAPGVEPAADVLARSRAVLEAQRPLLDRGAVVLVAHDVVNQILLADLEPALATGPIRQRTACWNRLRAEDAGWRVEVVDAVATAAS